MSGAVQEYNKEGNNNASTSGSGSCQNILELMSSIIPVSEAIHAEHDLRKTKISLSLNSCPMKRTKPRGRKTGLSQRERRAIGLFRLPRLSITYEEAEPMNRLWQAYMHRFLNFDSLRQKEWYNPKSGHLWDQMSVTLLKADYHGAKLRVASSLCSSMIGLEGIVVIDTKFTLQIVGKDDICRTQMFKFTRNVTRTNRKYLLKQMNNAKEMLDDIYKAKEQYLIVSEQLGHKLQKTAEFLDTYHTEINKTYNAIYNIVHGQPDQISRTDVAAALKGINETLKKEMRDELEQYTVKPYIRG